jgi:hypothetical protein
MGEKDDRSLDGKGKAMADSEVLDLLGVSALRR